MFAVPKCKLKIGAFLLVNYMYLWMGYQRMYQFINSSAGIKQGMGKINREGVQS